MKSFNSILSYSKVVLTSFFFSLITLCSCESSLEENPPPKNLIAKDTFQLILQDLLVLEAHVQNKYRSIPNYYKILKREGQNIFKNHDVDSSRFNVSFSYYSRHQELLNEIYTSIADSINIKQFALENENDIPKDSLIIETGNKKDTSAVILSKDAILKATLKQAEDKKAK